MFNFNDAKRMTQNKLKNFNLPKALLDREEVKMSDLVKGKSVVSIDYFAIRTQVKKKKNDETGKYESVLTKDGREIMQGVIYIGLDGDFYTVTASGAMLSQVAMLMNVDSVVGSEPGLQEFPELCSPEGEKPCVIFEEIDVKYRDGKTYQQTVIGTTED